MFIQVEKYIVNTDHIYYVGPDIEGRYKNKIIMKENNWVKTNLTLEEIMELINNSTM